MRLPSRIAHLVCVVLVAFAAPRVPAHGDEPLRLGIIGVDTSHTIAFTKLLHAEEPGEDLRGVRVVALYPRGSWDIPSSVVRLPKNTQEMRDLGVEIVDSIAELVARVDGVLLETNDGRPHLEQALPVLRARKPLFIDKPVAGTLADALAIYELAASLDTPVFTSSSLRYTEGAQAIRAGAIGDVLAADCYSPASLEPTHPDLFWYGIHGVEPLFTVMGVGCRSVARSRTAGQEVVVGEWTGGRLGTFRGQRVGSSGYGGRAFGAKGVRELGDYGGYRPLVVEIVRFVRTLERPVEAAESLEIYAFMEAADESWRRGGASVGLDEVVVEARSRYAISGGVVADTAVPGGNAVIEGFDGDEVRLRPDLRDTTRWWFWWQFRVRGAEGRTLTFRFPEPSPIGVRGPAVSRDHGATWSWLGTESVDGASFRYTFAGDETTVRFAFAPPYTGIELRRFLARVGEHPNVRRETLGESRRRRPVEMLRVGRLGGEAKSRVLITARHHACETMASFALEGIVDAALAGDELGAWMRENVELLAVPMMDVDGAEEGDQGKLRAPHDHNRDYGGDSIYPSVRALREFAPRWSAGRCRIGIDLHCPYIRGGNGPGSNTSVFCVGVEGDAAARELARFSTILEATREGPLPYAASSNLPFGIAWNTAEDGMGESSAAWMASLDGVRLATTIELPYATAGGVEVTPDAARAFGRDLARAMKEWLSASE